MPSPTGVSSGILWFRSDSGVYQDSGLLTGCTDNTLVYSWKNLTGNNEVFTESNTGFQPTLYTGSGFGGYPRINFTGNKALTITTGMTDPLTFFLVGTFISIGNTSNSMWFDGNGDVHRLAYVGTSTLLPFFFNGGSTYNLSVANSGQLTLFTIVSNSTSSSAKVNIVPITTTFTPPITTTTSLVLMNGGSTPHTWFLNGDLYEFIVYNKALSPTEVNLVESYLTGRYPIVASAAKKSIPADSNVIDSYRAINIGGPTSFSSSNTYGGHLRSNVYENLVDGNPAAPCLSVGDGWNPTFANFRWIMDTAGPISLSVNVKQVSNSSPRPTVIVKANPSIGINSDVVSGVPSGVGWITVGPITVTPTAPGVVIVELWNNSLGNRANGPALFDQVIIQ